MMNNLPALELMQRLPLHASLEGMELICSFVLNSKLAYSGDPGQGILYKASLLNTKHRIMQLLPQLFLLI